MHGGGDVQERIDTLDEFVHKYWVEYARLGGLCEFVWGIYMCKFMCECEYEYVHICMSVGMYA